MATGTSQNFSFASGNWANAGYSAVIDDESGSSTGKLVNNLRQWEWDLPDIGSGRISTGSDNFIVFIPGTSVDNGEWFNATGSDVTNATAGSRNGRVITLPGGDAVFTETDAFVNGVVPHTGGSAGGGTGTEGVNTPYVTWLFPNRSCGATTYVSVTHTEATSSATSYTVHDDTGQIGTILVGTGSTATANFGFTISARTLQVKNSAGSVIGTRVFTCNRKVFCNFW